MIVKEIKHFKLKFGELDGIDVSLPASVLSALTEQGIIREPYHGTIREDVARLCEDGAELIGEFDVDAAILSMDSMMLDVGGLDAPAVVLVNGVPLAGISHPYVPLEIDIKRQVHLGKNTLRIRLAPRGAGEDYITDVSVFRPIVLRAYSGAAIEDVTVRERFVGSRVHLDIEMTTVGYNLKPRAVAILVSPGGDVSYATLIDGKGSIDVGTPSLWSPGRLSAHGLYKLTVNLYSDTEIKDTKELSIGLRSVTYTECGAPVLTLNGKPFLPVSLTHTETDLIPPRETEERLERMLRLAVAAGVEMIYCNSDKSYPSESFMSLCDRLGIALAVKGIAREAEGAADAVRLRAEACRSLRILKNHPSVIAVVDTGVGGGVVGEVAADMLPNAVVIAGGLDTGSHVPALMSDYTARTYLGAEDKNLYSPTMVERGGDDLALLVGAAFLGHRIPHSFGEWTYLSGVVSAEREIAALDLAREARGGIAVNLGSLSEAYPGVSASLCDYSVRPKALYYYLSRATSPVRVWVKQNGLKISFYITNKTTKLYNNRLSYAVVRNDNRTVVRDSVEVSCPPETTALVYEYDFKDILLGHENEYFLSYFLADGGAVSSGSTHLFVAAREFSLLKPTVTAEISGAGTEYTVTLYSDVYARGVEVWLEGDEDAILEDNFIDLASDMSVRVRLTTRRPTAIETLRRELRVRSLYDVGR